MATSPPPNAQVSVHVWAKDNGSLTRAGGTGSLKAAIGTLSTTLSEPQLSWLLQTEDIVAEQAAFLLALDQLADNPDLPGVPYGLELVHKDTGETKVLAIPGGNVKGVMQALRTQAKAQLPHGKALIEEHLKLHRTIIQMGNDKFDQDVHVRRLQAQIDGLSRIKGGRAWHLGWATANAARLAGEPRPRPDQLAEAAVKASFLDDDILDDSDRQAWCLGHQACHDAAEQERRL